MVSIIEFNISLLIFNNASLFQFHNETPYVYLIFFYKDASANVLFVYLFLFGKLCSQAHLVFYKGLVGRSRTLFPFKGSWDSRDVTGSKDQGYSNSFRSITILSHPRP